MTSIGAEECAPNGQTSLEPVVGDASLTGERSLKIPTLTAVA